MASAYVGCSGYDYPHWRGILYPPGLPRARWLAHYATVFDTVELNSTFYGLPSTATVRVWRDSVPPGFCFAVKLSRFGTHRKRLRDPEQWVAPFLERVEHLGPALGPVLVQLPPRFSPDPPRLASFLDVVPATRRFAVEVRDPRWLCEEVYAVLREHDAALCVHDLIPGHPRVVTATWTYLRFHGPGDGPAYTSGYRREALAGAARRIRRHLDEGRDVYAYFNNDAGGHAVHDARALKRMLARTPR
jgi:uncharacterized protein YecE (DUF72 family)